MSVITGSGFSSEKLLLEPKRKYFRLQSGNILVACSAKLIARSSVNVTVTTRKLLMPYF